MARGTEVVQKGTTYKQRTKLLTNFLLQFKLLKISNLKLVEAAGVGQAPQPQSKQLIDSEKFKSVMIVIIFRSRHNPVTNGR
jgi:hypothetical protein